MVAVNEGGNFKWRAGPAFALFRRVGAGPASRWTGNSDSWPRKCRHTTTAETHVRKRRVLRLPISWITQARAQKETDLSCDDRRTRGCPEEYFIERGK